MNRGFSCKEQVLSIKREKSFISIKITYSKQIIFLYFSISVQVYFQLLFLPSHEYDSRRRWINEVFFPSLEYVRMWHFSLGISVNGIIEKALLWWTNARSIDGCVKLTWYIWLLCIDLELKSPIIKVIIWGEPLQVFLFCAEAFQVTLQPEKLIKHL